jgi:zinc/manganese transport system permease protein
MESQSTLVFLVVPFSLALVLSGIHVYLGLHVLSRGIIFVDLALAQIAALGTTIAYLLGYDFDTNQAYIFALGFTIVGAILFSLTRGYGKGRVPQEAFIGIVYAVASALTVIALTKAPHGAEHLSALLVRDILWVQDPFVVAKVALIYAVIGFLHIAFRRYVILATFNPEALGTSKAKIFAWDLFFYCSFGLVVTSSVQLAGVLLVFSYLMVPSVMSALLVGGIIQRLLLGWGFAFLASVIGILLSYKLDAPTGAMIIITFGGGLLLQVILMALFGSRLKRTLAGFHQPRARQ